MPKKIIIYFHYWIFNFTYIVTSSRRVICYGENFCCYISQCLRDQHYYYLIHCQKNAKSSIARL